MNFLADLFAVTWLFCCALQFRIDLHLLALRLYSWKKDTYQTHMKRIVTVHRKLNYMYRHV